MSCVELPSASAGPSHSLMLHPRHRAGVACGWSASPDSWKAASSRVQVLCGRREPESLLGVWQAVRAEGEGRGRRKDVGVENNKPLRGFEGSRSLMFNYK